MKRCIHVGLLATLAVLTVWGLQGVYNEVPTSSTTTSTTTENYCRPLRMNEGTACDHDGRLHPCGWVTPDGVTEYIDVYVERCNP